MFGFLLFSFLYLTKGVVYPRVPIRHNHLYNLAGNSYRLFGNIFFLLVFLSCLTAGWFLNGRSFKGIEVFFRDTGYHSNFAKKYGMRLCLINIGLYGLFFLVYINIVIHFTEGSGFTAPTFGVILAALTFTSILILLPILEHYVSNPRNDMNHHIDLRDMITIRDSSAPQDEKKP